MIGSSAGCFNVLARPGLDFKTQKVKREVDDLARQLQVQLDAMSKARLAKENLETDLRAEAKVKGYEGESCRECGNFTLLRNGTCMKCDTCGSTTGCS